MDPKEFTENSRGDLVDEGGDNDRKAFVPGSIPDYSEIESGVNFRKAMVAAKNIGTIDNIGRDMENPSLMVLPYLRREAISSSRIEGTHTSLKEYLESETEKEIKDRDTREAKNYQKAVEKGLEYMRKEGSLGLDLFRKLHSWLFEGIDIEGRKGEFRDSQNYIGMRYTPPPPEKVPELMERLEKYINDLSSESPELIKIALIHYQFEAIHPFSDGNGRIGRILIILLLEYYNLLKTPLLYLSEFFEKNRQKYIYNLHRISTHGSYSDWINFFLDAVVYQSENTIEKTDKLRDLRDDYHSRIKEKRYISHTIIDILFKQPLVTKPLLVSMTEKTFPGVSNNVEKLLENNILKEIGGRPTKYICPDILDIIDPEGETFEEDRELLKG